MPGDLNLKKSWNPALMKNQKKVWEREQQALKELQTIKQRQKEIAQEREKEELIRLQYGSDPSSMPKKDKLELNKLGWMYNDGPKTQDDENESGFREVEEDFLAKSDEMEQLLRGNKAVKTSSSRFDKVALVGTSAAPKSLSDDPLLAIRKEQFKRRSDNRERSPLRLRSHLDRSRGDEKDAYRASHRDSSHRDSRYNGSRNKNFESRGSGLDRHHDRDRHAREFCDREPDRHSADGRSRDRHNPERISNHGGPHSHGRSSNPSSRGSQSRSWATNERPSEERTDRYKSNSLLDKY
ncbi:Pre-mRNA splicing factor [Metschnikowia aff. pulcherrima]|uniref:Pre-mRNA-splicing factor CWC25 n=1 Tax=Metschnikowia aff. pulcherrima TaxID=2163413 RepID=A0A4P6XT07_9ASCO|nr:Pre-mRNA splicing factor [Metschnikowia aff. pulcherrima]